MSTAGNGDWQHTACGAAVAAALRPDASFAALDEAARALNTLVDRSMRGDGEAYAEHQFVLYALHDNPDCTTDLRRRLLADEAYRAEERHIPRVSVAHPLPEGEFHAKLEETLQGRSRVEHPMSRYLFNEHPSVEQIRLFLRHQWFRTYKLYQDATDLAVRLYDDVTDAAALYRYLYGEAGEEDPAAAHALLLQSSCRHLDVPCEFRDRSTLLAEVAYLNNRRRSFRNTDIAWGLAVFYVTEIVVSSNHKKLYQMLRTADVPEEFCEYYRVHIGLVPPRAKREWQMIGQYLERDRFQETFLTSLERHLELEGRYYDAVWREVQAAGPRLPSAGVEADAR